MQDLLDLLNPALTFLFIYGHSIFLQCFSVALSKRVISGSVHAGYYMVSYDI